MMPLGKPLEQILAIVALLLLAIGCFVVLRPFLSALLWAAVLCFSTWRAYGWCERALGGRRGLAAALMTALVALVLVAPLAVVVATLAESVSRLVAAVARLLEQGPPSPPLWVAELPAVGESLAAYWEGLAHDAPAFTGELRKLIGPAADLALGGGAVLGAGILELSLSVFIAFFFYRDGREVAARVSAIAERFAGPRAQRLLGVAGATVKGVVYGILGTALAQGLLAALGFWIAGVPGALFLGFLTFGLSLAPMGPPLVWGSAALWLLAQGAVAWGVFVALWGALVVSSVDNLLKPYLMSRGSDLPLVLVFLGAVGGVLAFGFIGVFLGPTLLAVGYSLFLEWSAAEAEARGAGRPPPVSSDAA
jgi:predicted PurR-regulated permease PerM